MPYVDLGEFTMFYTDERDGPPVLCVHGWTCDGSDWSWQVPAFVPGHRVIAVDPRGHGRSTAPADGYGPLFFADDLAALLARLGTGPVVAMGHSMGGATVVALAVEHPELVRAVVSVTRPLGSTRRGSKASPSF
jgi:pimeloyl-ACP methyl ester carboxylesterase